MAGVDKLKERILNDNKKLADEIINDANLKAQEVINAAKQRAEELLKDSEARAQRDGKDKKDRILARTQLEARNSILKAKQEAIDKVLDKTIEKIKAMTNEEYTEFIEKLLLNVVETGDEDVIFSINDRLRVKPDLIDRVNKKLESMGKKGLLRISSDERDISSGFVLKRGGLEINSSIEAQIRIMRDSLESEIANLLFEGR